MLRALTEMADPDADTQNQLESYQRFIAASYETDVIEPAALSGTDMAGESKTTGPWLRDVATQLCNAILDRDQIDSQNVALQLSRGRRTHEPHDLSENERAVVTKNAYYLLVTNVLSDLPQPNPCSLLRWEGYAREQVTADATSSTPGSVYSAAADYSTQRRRVLSDFLHYWFSPWCRHAAFAIS